MMDTTVAVTATAIPVRTCKSRSPARVSSAFLFHCPLPPEYIRDERSTHQHIPPILPQVDPLLQQWPLMHLGARFASHTSADESLRLEISIFAHAGLRLAVGITNASYEGSSHRSGAAGQATERLSEG